MKYLPDEVLTNICSFIPGLEGVKVPSVLFRQDTMREIANARRSDARIFLYIESLLPWYCISSLKDTWLSLNILVRTKDPKRSQVLPYLSSSRRNLLNMSRHLSVMTNHGKHESESTILKMELIAQKGVDYILEVYN